MTVFNLADYKNDFVFEGDYVGDLPAQMRAAAGRGQNEGPLVTPLQRPLQTQAGGGGKQAVFEPARAPLIRQASVAQKNTQAGWRAVDNYKGFLIQEYISHVNQPPLYRGIWGGQATKPSATPADVYRQIDKSAARPPIKATRIQPGEKGNNSNKLHAWSQRLQKARRNWGRTGHVETFQGVRIFRGKRNEVGPDGNKVTVPYFYSKQRLKGVRPAGDAPLKGYLALFGIGADNQIAAVDGTAEADTLDEMKQIIETHPLAESEQIAPEGEGPGPAAGNTPVEALPGEAGTSPEMNKKAVAIGGGLAAVALMFLLK